MPTITILLRSIRISRKESVSIFMGLFGTFAIMSRVLPFYLGNTKEDTGLMVFMTFVLLGTVSYIIGPLQSIKNRTKENYHKTKYLVSLIPKKRTHIYIGRLVDRIRLFRLSYFLLIQFLLTLISFISDTISPSFAIIAFFFLSVALILIFQSIVKWGMFVFAMVAALHLAVIVASTKAYDPQLILIFSLISLISFIASGWLYYRAGRDKLWSNESTVFDQEKRFWSKTKLKSIKSLFAEIFLTSHNLERSYAYYSVALLFAFISLTLVMIYESDYLYLVMLVSIYAIFKGSSYGRSEANEILKTDNRSKILLLRSFNDDGHLTEMESKRFEDIVVSITNKLGPTVCIGDPRESIIEPGAYRAYIRESNDTSWQHIVQQWMDDSQLILLVAGSTAFLGWELIQLKERQCLHKTIIIMPPELMAERSERWEAFIGYLEPLYSSKQLTDIQHETLIAIVHDSDGTPLFIHSIANTVSDYRTSLKVAISML